MTHLTVDACMALFHSLTKAEQTHVQSVARSLLALQLPEETVSGIIAVVVVEAATLDPNERHDVRDVFDAFRGFLGAARPRGDN